MADYRASSLTAATKWQRSNVITINNPLPGRGNPTIAFQEQEVVAVDGEVIAVLPKGGPMGLIREFDPEGSFPLLNPETGESLGVSMSHVELRVALYSLYIQSATARDEQEAAQTPIAPEPSPAPAPNPAPEAP